MYFEENETTNVIECIICQENKPSHNLYKKTCPCIYDICSSCINDMIKHNSSNISETQYNITHNDSDDDNKLKIISFLNNSIKCLYCRSCCFQFDVNHINFSDFSNFSNLLNNANPRRIQLSYALTLELISGPQYYY
jgi:hypothetical protein